MASDAAPQRRFSRPAPRRPQMLIVDDDELVSQMLARALRSLRPSWLVRSAASGEDALLQLRQGGPVQVMLTDLHMPGMDGVDLARAVRRNHPQVVRVAHTGTTDLADRLPDPSLFHFVALKPMAIDRLALLLDAALQASAGGSDPRLLVGGELSDVG